MTKKSKRKIKKDDEEILKYRFDPPLRNRYLPGEASNSFVAADFEKYRKHRLLVAQAKALVDDRPPIFKIKAYYDKDKLEDDARLAMINCRMNLDLARDINKKFRMEAKVDCWNLSQVILGTDQTFLKADYKDLMARNKSLYECLKSLTSEYSPQVMAKEWKKLKSIIEHQSKYPRFKDELKYPSITDLSVAKPESPNPRPRCFFDLELEQTKSPLGRIVFELYSEYAPRACANFEAFCIGHNGLSYEGTSFHRILSDYGCQGGDVTKFNGLGGASIYDSNSGRDQKCPLKHMCPGVLSSYNDENEPCDSKFNLSFRPLRSMDGKKLVFGKVIKGIPVLSKIDAYGSKFGRPLQKVIIAKCGTWPSTVPAVPSMTKSKCGTCPSVTVPGIPSITKSMTSRSQTSRASKKPKCPPRLDRTIFG